MIVKVDMTLPKWALPLERHADLLGAKGGRASGKSHYFAEKLVERIVSDPDCSAVCIREIQKSMRFSIKRLIEQKIRKFKVGHLFKIMRDEIRAVHGTGIVIFQGMQDHTADSIKSLEDFDIFLCEEADKLSDRSIKLLTPTIRKENAEMWAIWNPEHEDCAIEKLFNNAHDAILVKTTYLENPYCTKKTKNEAEACKLRDYEEYLHVWMGGYGMDFGFANDPTVLVEAWIKNNNLYVRHSFGRVGLELNHTTKYFTDRVDDLSRHAIRADCARPESISYLHHHGLPRIISVSKTKIDDGIKHLQSFDHIIVHPDCEMMADELVNYSYKIDRYTGDVMPVIIDKYNHCIDALRYAVRPMLSGAGKFAISKSTLMRAKRR